MNVMRIIFVFIMLVFVYGGAHFYTAGRLYQWVNLLIPNLNIKFYIGIFIFLALSIILGFMPFPSGIKYIINIISAYWLGIFVYLFSFTIAADLCLLFAKLIKIIPYPIPQNILFWKGLIVLILTAGIVSYGLYNANQIKHVSYNVQIKNLSLSSEIKIVMISDLHLGAVNSERNLKKIVQRINETNPDIVCITGDIFNDDYNSIRSPSKVIDLLKSINSTYGVYACLGNHDGGKTLNSMISLLEQSNITLLNDEYVTIDNRLILIGRLDPFPIGGFGDMQRKDIKEIFTMIDTNLPIVVMDHNPSNIHQYGKETDLIISGHTHRGQIFPGSLITKALFTVDYGHYQKDIDSPHVIVTSGAGTWGTPMRIGTNNEIVSITFISKTQQ